MKRRDFLKTTATAPALAWSRAPFDPNKGGLRIAYIGEPTLLDVLTGTARLVLPVKHAVMLRHWAEHSMRSLGLLLQSPEWEPVPAGETPPNTDVAIVYTPQPTDRIQ
ncbi:MAG: hypothetical protein AB7U73_01200 [Pirellulales bacterium]